MGLQTRETTDGEDTVQTEIGEMVKISLSLKHLLLMLVHSHSPYVLKKKSHIKIEFNEDFSFYDRALQG